MLSDWAFVGERAMEATLLLLLLLPTSPAPEPLRLCAWGCMVALRFAAAAARSDHSRVLSLTHRYVVVFSQDNK